MTVEILAPFGAKAEQELGMGCPPSYYGGDNVDQQLADECSPGAKIRVVEEGIWTIDFPILDTQLPTFAQTINPLGTPDNTPPPGVLTNTNTLAAPNVPPNSMIVRGIWVAIRVEPEARTIRTNVLNNSNGGVVPVSPDVFTQNDILNDALGLAGGTTMTPGEILHGLATWRFAYALVKAKELIWSKNHQERLIQQPLETVANIQPFAQSEAAGLAFASNADIINEANARLFNLGQPNQYLPITHKRLGSVNQGGATNLGVFAPSREEDAAPTIFGGIGVPYGPIEKAPYMFTTPIWWPRGTTMNLYLGPLNSPENDTMQRWLSLTGGNTAAAGPDEALPISGSLAGLTATGATVGLEMTLDTLPVFVSQQVQTNRWIGKSGRVSIAMGVIGRRVSSDAWLPIIAKAVSQGLIACPQGYGDLNPYMSKAA